MDMGVLPGTRSKSTALLAENRKKIVKIFYKCLIFLYFEEKVRTSTYSSSCPLDFSAQLEISTESTYKITRFYNFQMIIICIWSFQDYFQFVFNFHKDSSNFFFIMVGHCNNFFESSRNLFLTASYRRKKIIGVIFDLVYWLDF